MDLSGYSADDNNVVVLANVGKSLQATIVCTRHLPKKVPSVVGCIKKSVDVAIAIVVSVAAVVAIFVEIAVVANRRKRLDIYRMVF